VRCSGLFLGHALGVLLVHVSASVVAILLALLIAVTTVGAVFFGGDAIGGPAQVVCSITMVMIRLLVVFSALSARLLRRVIPS